MMDLNSKKMLAKMNTDLPYIIHGCVPSDQGIFPTHTHGAENEFLINHKCFGPKGNGAMINLVHKYLEENPDEREKVMDGEIREFSLEGSNLVLCFRKVNSDFAPVQIAYEGFGLDGEEFIQIYVKGDDFALTDEYYLNDEQK